MRNRHIYFTAMLAAAPAAVASILAVTPPAGPANVQLSGNAAIHNAPLDPCELDLDGNCNIPGIPGDIDNFGRGNINLNPPNVNINPPNVNLPGRF